MGRLALFLVAAALLGSAIAHRGAQQNIIEGQRQLDEYTSKSIARVIAQTGLAEAEQNYFQDFKLLGNYAGPATLTGNYQGGSYTTHFYTSSPISSIKVVGQFDGQSYTIERLYDEKSASGLPAFMSSAVTCERDISVTAELTMQSADPTKNANLVANRKIKILQPSTIEGFAFHGGSLNLFTETEEDVFQPNANSDNEPVAQQIAPLNIPAFNAADHAGLATITSSTNVDLSGPIALGTKESPAVWYIDGNLHITGPTEISGYGILLVTGDVHFQDHITFTDASVRSSFGLYANKNIHINAPNLDLGGQWFTNRSFIFNQDTNFNGSLTSRGGDCIFNQDATITYVPASIELTAPIWGGIKELKPLQSREW